MTDEKLIEHFVATKGPLQSLTPAEVELETLPLTIYPDAVRPRVKAWVRFGAQPVRVDAVIARANERAVGIEFTVSGKTYRCWVWASAVQLAS